MAGVEDQARDRGWIAPMLATPGAVPPTGVNWAFEVKQDGVRAIVSTGPRGVRMRSRNERELTSGYPELAALPLEPGLILDAEIVALDSAGRSDFELLQQRIHRSHPNADLQSQVRVSLVVFDLLHRDSQNLCALPYRERRESLAALALDEHQGIQVPPYFTGIAGPDMLDAADTQGLEGIVAKQLSSPYLPGRRSRTWIKIPIRHRATVTVIGWAPRRSSRNSLGALLIAVPDADGHLTYAGDVGTGFSQAQARELLDELRKRERDDSAIALPRGRRSRWRPNATLDGVHWVEPGVLGDIAYRSRTRDGAFRHASWQGLRTDIDMDDLVPTDL